MRRVVRADELAGAPVELGIPGVTASARPEEWDAVESTHAADLVGNAVHFVAL